MKLTKITHPYRAHCDNCSNDYIAYKTVDGLIAFKCPVCGTKIRIRRVAKGHIIKELRVPKNAGLLN